VSKNKKFASTIAEFSEETGEYEVCYSKNNDLRRNYV